MAFVEEQIIADVLGNTVTTTDAGGGKRALDVNIADGDFTVSENIAQIGGTNVANQGNAPGWMPSAPGLLYQSDGSVQMAYGDYTGQVVGSNVFSALSIAHTYDGFGQPIDSDNGFLYTYLGNGTDGNLVPINSIAFGDTFNLSDSIFGVMAAGYGQNPSTSEDRPIGAIVPGSWFNGDFGTNAAFGWATVTSLDAVGGVANTPAFQPYSDLAVTENVMGVASVGMVYDEDGDEFTIVSGTWDGSGIDVSNRFAQDVSNWFWGGIAVSPAFTPNDDPDMADFAMPAVINTPRYWRDTFGALDMEQTAGLLDGTTAAMNSDATGADTRSAGFAWNLVDTNWQRVVAWYDYISIGTPGNSAGYSRVLDSSNIDSYGGIIISPAEQVGSSLNGAEYAPVVITVPYTYNANPGNGYQQFIGDGDGNLLVNNPNSQTSATFTATNTPAPTTINVVQAPKKDFSFTITLNGGTVTLWDVRLEESLDATTWTEIAQHTNATGAGVIVTVTGKPCTYYRTRCAGLTLGTGTGITATVLAM